MPYPRQDFGISFFDALARQIPQAAELFQQRFEQERQRQEEINAFKNFQQGITEAHAQPIQMGVIPAQPAPISDTTGLPTRLSVRAQPLMGVNVQNREVPPSDPRFLNAAMNYLQATPGAANTLQSYLKIRELSQPTYTQKEIPAYGTLGTFEIPAGGGPPQFISAVQGQTHPTQADRYFVPRMVNGKPVTAKFGNMTRTIEDEYDRATNKPTGVWKYGEGGAENTSGGVGAWVQTKDAMGRPTGFINKLTNEVKPLSEFPGAEGMVGAPLSSTTKTMIETAPKVKELVTKLQSQIDAASTDQGADKLGPLAGRWNQFMTGQVGAANPEFNKIRVNAGLLSTLLMRMHVGARGSEKIMEKFDNLLGIGYQSPENLKAALDQIGSYADTVESEKAGISPSTSTQSQTPKPTHRYNPTTGQIELIK